MYFKVQQEKASHGMAKVETERASGTQRKGRLEEQERDIWRMHILHHHYLPSPV